MAFALSDASRAREASGTGPGLEERLSISSLSGFRAPQSADGRACEKSPVAFAYRRAIAHEAVPEEGLKAAMPNVVLPDEPRALLGSGGFEVKMSNGGATRFSGLRALASAIAGARAGYAGHGAGPVEGDGRNPAHVAIIMDGNGRWAEKRGVPRSLGHREGAETLKRIARYLRAVGVRYLTVYAFSTENWKRPQSEVNSILGLMRNYIASFDRDPERDKIRVRFIGDVEALDPALRKSFADITEKTRENEDAIVLTIAFNYGGRAEIARAARKAAKLASAGLIKPDDLDERLFGSLLNEDGVPDPDLLIRPGAEQRVSNFLLWEIAYAELWFTDVLWPDFSEKDIDGALAAYRARRRRFGGVGDANQDN